MSNPMLAARAHGLSAAQVIDRLGNPDLATERDVWSAVLSLLPPVAEQVATIDRYQRECWLMHYADMQMGPGVDIGDPTERNYWMVLPAERVADGWMYVESDAECVTCHRPYDEHGWGDGLDGCVLS
jgi:hypothetical protein